MKSHFEHSVRYLLKEAYEEAVETKAESRNVDPLATKPASRIMWPWTFISEYSL